MDFFKWQFTLRVIHLYLHALPVCWNSIKIDGVLFVVCLFLVGGGGEGVGKGEESTTDGAGGTSSSVLQGLCNARFLTRDSGMQGTFSCHWSYKLMVFILTNNCNHHLSQEISITSKESPYTFILTCPIFGIFPISKHSIFLFLSNCISWEYHMNRLM